jgi:hypothetical protein
MKSYCHYSHDTRTTLCGLDKAGLDKALPEDWEPVNCPECLEKAFANISDELFLLDEWYRMMTKSFGLNDPYYEHWKNEQSNKRIEQLKMIVVRQRECGYTK